MCGRFTQTLDLEELKEHFYFVTDLTRLERRFNIAPTQESPVIIFRDGVNVLRTMRWGLIPHWARDEKTGYRMINARAEGIEKKPAFKEPLRNRRCLIIADGFYEWDKRSKRGGAPFRFTLKGGEPFAFAGLWDRWRNREGLDLETFTIVTTEANELILPLHDRMPVMLHRRDYEKWVKPDVRDLDTLKALLAPFPPGEMTGYRVSPRVNSPRYDDPECVRAVPETG